MRPRLLFFAAILFLALTLSFAQQPTPHGIAGRVFNHDGSNQVPAGTAYLVNDTASHDFVRGATGPPGGPGRYSVAIDGNDGDAVYVLAWNASHYGNATFTLLGDMDGINFNISIPRPSEPNLTFIYPPNSTSFNLTLLYNFTANLTLGGGTAGTGCFATLHFSPAGVLTTPLGATLNLGSIPLRASWQLNWTVLGAALGSANATINATCASDGYNFDGLTVSQRFNLSVIDAFPPLVTLIHPPNNTLNATHHNITLFYNASDGSNLSSCSLIINGQTNLTTGALIQRPVLNFSARLGNGPYNWSVNCTDAFGNVGASVTHNLTVDVPPISFTNVLVTDPVFLIAAGTQVAWCNATVTGQQHLNATLHLDGSSPLGPNDNNSRYLNASCLNSAGNYSCSFHVAYYAQNGTWQCNLTAANYEGERNSTNRSFVIEQLSAIEILPNVIEFGNIAAGALSSIVPVNVSNVGNTPLDLELFAYGESVNDSLALDCNLGNVTIENIKVSTNTSTEFDSMRNVSAFSTAPTELTLGLAKRVSTHTYNTTYWRLSAPAGQPRNCTGIVVFSALIG